MNDKEYQKRLENAEYRKKLVEAELGAIKGSKAYKVSKILGSVKAQLKSDPVGLSKKAARIIFTEPKKARHLFRSASRGAFIAQSVAEQAVKYQEWILLNEPDEEELDAQRKASEKLGYRPLISIITPVFNPPVGVLEELIESVLEQTYTNFELCLGNFGTEPGVQALIDKYAVLDNRIKNWVFSENGGIAFNSNQILAKASGEYIALLDHDDTLSADALFENVKLLNKRKYDFIYSDKDKIDERGNRFDPLFKADLSPEMLLNVNYLTHLNVMKTEVVKAVGAWDTETDGAQDWDLFLKILTRTKNFAHIPKVLYHWRVIASSTAMSIETKPYALAGQRKALDKYLTANAIPATAYHRQTEVLLKWEAAALDQSPLVFVYHTNNTNTMRTIRQVRKHVLHPHFILLVAKHSGDVARVQRTATVDVLPYQESPFEVIAAFLAKDSNTKGHKSALFLVDNLRFPKEANWYEDLAGWLSIPEVAIVSGRLVDRRDLIVSSGGTITSEGDYTPLFKGFPRFYQSYIGNAEWVRNLSIAPAIFMATRLSELVAYTKSVQSPSFDGYCLHLTQTAKRLVMTPHATASLYEDTSNDQTHPVVGSKKLLRQRIPGTMPCDPYSNPNLSPSDPLRLFADEPLVGVDQSSEAPVDTYQHDAAILTETFDITQEQLEVNKRIVTQKGPIVVRDVAWFLPAFDAVYAGLVNIFSFANYLQSQKLQTTFYILSATSDISEQKRLISEKFPKLASASYKAIRPGDITKISQHDVGIATLWSTAFVLAKAPNFKRKCYFIQDNEVNFYPKGSISALVELSYKFGFFALANTPGLLEMYKEQYGGEGVVTTSRVDLSAYRPRADKYYAPKKPYKVFFYARPNMPRNAFELGIAGLKKLKQKYGEDVEIITAGAPWEPSSYGVQGMFTNLGKIAYEAVPRLYRSIDAGLMFMFSGHPGVTASELMASGCPVVVNDYDDITWHELYQHEKTCLITTATASEVARSLERCLTDKGLRKRLIDGGLKKSSEFYGGYEASLKNAYNALMKGEG